MKKKVKKFIIYLIVVFIAFYLLSFFAMPHCDCGGCCAGCPGDCNRIDLPFTIYYWGVNELTYEPLSQFTPTGLISNLVFWLIVLSFGYWFILRKKN